MGTLVVQIGQCGNQIGMKLWDQLKSQHNSTSDFMFRNGDSVSHSILVDTEPKVLQAIKAERMLYPQFDPKNVLYFQHGRGNNWAMGYFNSKTQKIGKKEELFSKFDKLSVLEKANLLQKSRTNFTTSKNALDKETSSDEFILRENSAILEQATTMIQKEIEKVDYYTAGGTGSGVGSRLIEAMRDEYSTNMIFNTAVFPTMTGENPLQQYNCVLALSHLQSYSDGIIYFQNEKVYKYMNRYGMSVEEKLVNVDDMNDYIASLLAHMFKINDLKNAKNFYFDYINELTALNECKFIELFATPTTIKGKHSYGPEATWDTVFEQGFLQLGFDQETDQKTLKENGNINSTLALKCILRSADIDSSFMKNETYKKTLEKKIHHGFHPVKWNPDAVSYDLIKDKLTSLGDCKSMMILANRISIVNVLKEIASIARSKYKAKAYLHWYYKYGMEEEDFMLAFENVDTIIDNYLHLLNQFVIFKMILNQPSTSNILSRISSLSANSFPQDMNYTGSLQIFPEKINYKSCIWKWQRTCYILQLLFLWHLANPFP